MRRHIVSLASIAVLFLGSATPGRAQILSQAPVAIPPNNTVGTTLVIGDGGPVTCEMRNAASPYRGQLILFEFGPDPQDGRTLITPGQPPRIRINPWSLNQKPAAAQMFLAAHECGHVNLYPDMSETAANCYAARRIRILGLLNQGGWESVYYVLRAAFPGPVGPYPSGDDQARLMNAPYCQ